MAYIEQAPTELASGYINMAIRPLASHRPDVLTAMRPIRLDRDVTVANPLEQQPQLAIPIDDSMSNSGYLWSGGPRTTRTGRAYSDDLRVRILEADERGEGSCRVLAKRFGVSWEYVRKLRRQQAATGQKARVAQSRYGVRSKVTEPVKTHMLDLVKCRTRL